MYFRHSGLASVLCCLGSECTHSSTSIPIRFASHPCALCLLFWFTMGSFSALMCFDGGYAWFMGYLAWPLQWLAMSSLTLGFSMLVAQLCMVSMSAKHPVGGMCRFDCGDGCFALHWVLTRVLARWCGFNEVLQSVFRHGSGFLVGSPVGVFILPAIQVISFFNILNLLGIVVHLWFSSVDFGAFRLLF